MLLLVSSILLFEEKIGFSFKGVLEYYIGSEEKFIVAKSSAGVLKIVLPHIFVFGLFMMVILHFLYFTKEKKIQAITYAAFTLSFLEIFSPLMIINGFEIFVYLKLVSFFLFETLVVYVLFLLFSSIVYF